MALAVIKNKPPGQSGREHAEALACQLRSLDEGWKNTALGLQQEVLSLRQELLLAKMASKTKSVREAAVSGCSTEALFPTPEATESSTRKPDPLPAASVSPLLPFTFGHLRGLKGRAMLLHMQFLQSLCGLHRADGKDGGLEAAWLTPDGDTGALLEDSVCQLLDSVVVAACKDAPSLPSDDLLLQACHTAAQVIDLCGSRKQLSAQVVMHMETSLKELIRILLHNHQLNRFECREKLMMCLIALGSSSLSKSFLIRHVLSQINGLAEQLWQASQVTEDQEFPTYDFANSIYLFWILEKLLQESMVPGREAIGSGVTAGWHWSLEHTAFLSHLEHHMTPLTDEYPLFGLYMWRIGRLLYPSNTS